MPTRVTITGPRTRSVQLRNKLIHESRGQCAICGSKSYLELTHIVPFAEGGETTEDNIMVLCPTCHRAVDSAGIPADFLRKAKNQWIHKNTPGKNLIQRVLADVTASLGHHKGIPTPRIEDAKAYSEALKQSSEFDKQIERIRKRITGVKNEADFLSKVLKPLFDALGYEGVTILHHSGRPEHGKDIVFYDRDRLGGFTWYAVVACKGSIHANSNAAAQASSGHCKKILDQIDKAFRLAYEEHNLKSHFFIDRVLVCCSDTISEEVMLALREWEREHKRHLVFLTAEALAGHKVRLLYKRR